MRRFSRWFLMALFALSLFACNMKLNPHKLEFQEADLQPQLDRMLRQILITETVTVELDNLQTPKLIENSRWQMVGRLPIGGVYRPVNTTLNIEEDQVFDAYLIVSEENNMLQGFYFPAKKAYVVLEPPRQLTLQK